MYLYSCVYIYIYTHTNVYLRTHITAVHLCIYIYILIYLFVYSVIYLFIRAPPGHARICNFISFDINPSICVPGQYGVAAGAWAVLQGFRMQIWR